MIEKPPTSVVDSESIIHIGTEKNGSTKYRFDPNEPGYSTQEAMAIKLRYLKDGREPYYCKHCKETIVHYGWDAKEMNYISAAYICKSCYEKLCNLDKENL